MSEDQTKPRQTRAERGSRRKLTGRIVNDTTKPGRAQEDRRGRGGHAASAIRSTASTSRAAASTTRTTRRNEYRTNDLVEIRESRPLSRTKRWVVMRLLKRPEEV